MCSSFLLELPTGFFFCKVSSFFLLSNLGLYCLLPSSQLTFLLNMLILVGTSWWSLWFAAPFLANYYFTADIASIGCCLSSIFSKLHIANCRLPSVPFELLPFVSCSILLGINLFALIFPFFFVYALALTYF